MLGRRDFLKATFGSTAIVTLAGAGSAQAQAANAAIQSAMGGLNKSEAGIAKFYAAAGYRPIFAGSKNRSRSKALTDALRSASAHGLPAEKYQGAALAKSLRSARKPNDVARLELAAARAFVTYANDVSGGILQPSRVDSEIAIKTRRFDAYDLLAGVAKSKGASFIKGLSPQDPEYKALISEKARLEKLMGKKEADLLPMAAIKPGITSPNVVILRKRLSSLGYGNLGNSKTYDQKLVGVVKQFQADRGLGADGIVGRATIDMVNLGPRTQYAKVVVNLERARWTNFSKGQRHINVNIPDFSVSVVDNGRVSFKSRTVVGQNKKDFRTPEFHDTMTHMVINPTWNIPKSIAVKEYVPIMQNDPGFLSKRNMYIVDSAGNPAYPSAGELAAYNASNFEQFPYFIKQRPDRANALGRVKFMFPNRFNIYLHDTPSRSLFARETRTFSHGCVRVHKPLEFAHLLLAKQTGNPKGVFSNYLNSGKETFVNLKQTVPVYLTYRTVYFDGSKSATYRSDVYGRDAKLVKALRQAGVAV